MTRLIAFGEALVDMLSSRLGSATTQETFTPYAGEPPRLLPQAFTHRPARASCVAAPYPGVAT